MREKQGFNDTHKDNERNREASLMFLLTLQAGCTVSCYDFVFLDAWTSQCGFIQKSC